MVMPRTLRLRLDRIWISQVAKQDQVWLVSLLQTLSRIYLTLLRESQLKPPYMPLFAFVGLPQPLFSTRAADTGLSILSAIKYLLSIVASSPLRPQLFHLLDCRRARPFPWFERRPTETGTPSHRGSRYQRRRGRVDGRQSRGPLANTTTALCRK